MAPKRVLAAFACAALVALGAPARADEYRAGEFFGLDLSTAVLSPKRLGPPAEFAPVAVEARTDAKRNASVAEPKADPPRVVRTTRVTPAVEKPRVAQVHVEKSRTPARAKLARRSNPLNAQAMDTRVQTTRVQTWPCRSGGICNWK
jgi:hypothetical protein